MVTGCGVLGKQKTRIQLNPGQEKVVGESGGVYFYLHSMTWERSKVLVTNGQTKKYLYPNIHVYRISPVWIAVRIVCSLSTMMTLSSPAEMKLKTFINNDRLSSLSEFVSYTAGRSE